MARGAKWDGVVNITVENVEDLNEVGGNSTGWAI